MLKKILPLALSAALGCAAIAADDTRLDAVESLTGDATTGQTLFAEECAKNGVKVDMD